MIDVFKYSGLLLLAYLMGSIPFGLILAALFKNQDIRSRGSGNIGATNVLRVAGVKPGLLTLILDVLKGALPVFLAVHLIDNPVNFWGHLYPSLVAIAAFLGHLYPLYLGLRGGGKGVATAWGCFLVISPAAALVSLLVFILLVCVSNRASVASLAGAAILPLAIWHAMHSPSVTFCSAMVTLLIIYKHKDNIVRLVQGTESAIWKI